MSRQAIDERDELKRVVAKKDAELAAMEKRARAYEAGATKIQAERDALAAVLNDIANPVHKLERDAKAEGTQINGGAFTLANDAEWLKDMARKGLEGNLS